MKIVRAILIGLAVAIVLLGGFAWLNYDKIEKPQSPAGQQTVHQ